jgi:predicted GIY-YIG superfamily endonuclease
MKNERNALYRVFSIYDDVKTLIYVGVSLDPLRRFTQHQDAPWYDYVDEIVLEHFPNRASALIAEEKAILLEDPMFNRQGKTNQREWKPMYHQTRTKDGSLSILDKKIIAIVASNEFEATSGLWVSELLENWDPTAVLYHMASLARAGVFARPNSRTYKIANRELVTKVLS